MLRRAFVPFFFLLALLAGCRDQKLEPSPSATTAPATSQPPSVISEEPPFLIRHNATPPVVAAPDTRTASEIASAACEGADGSWHCKMARPKPKLLGAGRPPIIPASWTVPNWYIDPSGANGGSDTNACTSSGFPCLTYAEVAARWGTYSPRLQQTTILTFTSSQTTKGDPIYFNPYVETNTYVQIVGQLPTATASGTLGTVTAKNRATPQLLQAVTFAGAAIGQLLVNTTHAGRAWIYTNVSGTTFTLSQPVTAAVQPFNPFAGVVEVESFAINDVVATYVPVSVNLVSVNPIIASFTGFPNYSQVFITDVTIPIFSDPGDTFYLGSSVVLQEVISQKAISMTNAQAYPMAIAEAIGGGGLYNVWMKGGGIVFNLNTSRASDLVSTYLIAGINGSSGASTTSRFINVYEDADSILAANSGGIGAYVTGGALANLYVETGESLDISGQSQLLASNGLSSSSPFLWGPGSLYVATASRFLYPNTHAAADLLVTGGLKINNSATACSSSGAATDVISCGITITGAHLDLANTGVSTGFGGTAFVPGGGTITGGAN